MKQEWYEYRVKYYNLKKDYVFNVLSYDELRSLWLPYMIFKVCTCLFIFLNYSINIVLIFQNTDLNEALTIEETYSEAYITREGSFTRAGIEFVDEAEVFEGKDNKITLTQTNSKKFHCNYLLHDFPFDVQVIANYLYGTYSGGMQHYRL